MQASVNKTEGAGGDSVSQKSPADAAPNGTDQDQVPTVFISYSHDSREHKEWVASFAQKLRANAVDVIFDQWDLGPGDDVPKFMEQAVARADRVLMICTEAYVRKADDGKGGVGYEAMVVTGELVRDLGTNKFIPVVRQTNSPKALPRCVCTRYFVDLSEGTDIEDQFETLLREIHDVPKLLKPPLGENPFPKGAFEGETKRLASMDRRLEFSESLSNPEMTYRRALEIIGTDDRVAWRKLLLAANDKCTEALKRWRIKRQKIPAITDTDCSARFTHVLSGIESYAPFIACLLAAAETGKEGYADQLGWIESVLDPAGYEESGPLYYAAFRQTVLFVAQALFGGMLMLSNSGGFAYQLATTKIPDSFRSREILPLFMLTRCNGWVETLDRKCTLTWQFLDPLITSWSWVKNIYGNEREFRSGIAAYYQLLSFLNFVKLAAANNLDNALKELGGFPVSVPLCFCVWSGDVVTAGYKIFLKQAPLFRRLLEANNLDQSRFESEWSKWITISEKWLWNVYKSIGPEINIPQRSLPKDMNANPYALS